MVTMDRVKRGAAKYIDTEFVNKLTGWQKWVFGAGSALLIENMEAAVGRFQGNEVVKLLGIMGENNTIDVEKLYRYMKREADKGPITFDAPLLGTVALNAADVEKLYTCIMQS